MPSPRDPAAGLYGDHRGRMGLVNHYLEQGLPDLAERLISLANPVPKREMAYTLPGTTMPECIPGSRCGTPIGLRCPACDGATSEGQTKRLHKQQGLGTYPKEVE